MIRNIISKMKRTNKIYQQLLRMSLMLLMVMGVSDVWSQVGVDRTGYYYIANKNDKDPRYNSSNNTDNYYLVPATNYYDAADEQPFLTTYKTLQDANSVWHVEFVKTENSKDYYRVSHYLSGKYITFNEKLVSSNADRVRVHLQAGLVDDDKQLIYFVDGDPDGVNICVKAWDNRPKQASLNPAKGNKDYYSGQNAGGPGSFTDKHGTTVYCGGLIGVYDVNNDGSRWFLEEAVPTPSYTVNDDGELVLSSVTGTTVRYTTNGDTPTAGSTSYSAPIDISGKTVIKVIAVRTSDSKISNVIEIPLADYTFNIVNKAGSVAIQKTVTLPKGYALSDYTSIPKAIRSPYLRDEEVRFFNNADCADEHEIHETPASAGNIYVTYTTDHLMEKFLHLRAARTFNLTVNGDYISDSGTNGSGTFVHNNATEEQKSQPEYLWFIGGNDPYALYVKNNKTDNYFHYSATPGSLSLTDTQSHFILMSGSAAGDGSTYEQMELMAATGNANYYRVGRSGDVFSISTTATGDATLQICARPNSSGITYNLIDKSGRLLKEIIEKSSELELPAAWQSPLVTTYHYYTNATTVRTYKDDRDSLTVAPGDEITTISQVPESKIVWVTYDVDEEFLFDTTDDDQNGSTTYMLRFVNGESFKQENGADGLSASATKAVYPYSNGDACLYVYGEEQWTAQLSSGASTRNRWLWYVVSPESDPYHVKIMSRSDQASGSHNYFRTYSVNYGGGTHIVTGVTTMNSAVDKDHANQLPTEYMVLKGADNHCKLVTVDLISDEHQTVTSFEQYWKNYETISKKGLYRYDEINNPEFSGISVHRYQAWANARPMDPEDPTVQNAKTYAEDYHWFQTIDMSTGGTSGEFEFIQTSLVPQLILVDKHGWEVMRKPLYSNDACTTKNEALKLYNSPMVQTYHWYPVATKSSGYHKYTIDEEDKPITIYAYNSETKKWVANGEHYTHTSSSLYDLPYDHISPTQGKDVMTDFYVTYDIWPEYDRLYSGAATEGATRASAFLLKQGSEYAKNDDNSLDAYSPVGEIDMENVDNNLKWYLKPNFNIDAEMGYIYAGNPGAQEDAESKSDMEAAYYAAGKNGLDPYNMQIQSVSGPTYYFKTTTTGSHLTGGAWAGTSTDLGLKNMSAGRQSNVDGYDQSELQITNATFMVVDDGSGHMRLMPRFDNSVVVNALTGGTKLTAPGDATNYFTFTLIPEVVHYGGQLSVLGGQYILAEDFDVNKDQYGNTFEFTSLGTESNPFTGSIDGRYHTFSGLTVPLIAYSQDATIKNIFFDNVVVTGGTGEDELVNVGAFVANAKGNTRIYNCGILASGSTLDENGRVTSCSSSVSGSNCVGGIVGHLDDKSRVINCYSYAYVIAGDTVGGIVGYNARATMQGNSQTNFDNNVKTMVMNCMFYGDITGGSYKFPVYGGIKIENGAEHRVNNYNYYCEENATFDDTYNNIDNYNNSWPVAVKHLQRFEVYRNILNSNRRLSTWWINGAYNTAPTDGDVDKVDIAKWVLDPAIAPYPILKPWGKYYSTFDMDPEYVYHTKTREKESRSTAEPWEGKSYGTLSVSISGGDNYDGSTSRDITITDMDTLSYDYCARKIQLPYYNDVFGNPNGATWAEKYANNYTSKVVTGWEITSVTGGTPGTFTADWQDGYNFADRNCTNKDKYSESGRVFAQGGYYYVPDGVTDITITAHWGNAVYLHNNDHRLDRANNGASDFYISGTLPTKVNDTYDIQTSLSAAVGKLSVNSSGTVYDQAIVLVGNYQDNAFHGAIQLKGGEYNTKAKPFTLMSADFDFDNEPDFCFQGGMNGGGRPYVQPIRFDFLTIPDITMAIRSNNNYWGMRIWCPQGHFEITETAYMYTTQFEYDKRNANEYKKHEAPLILNGGEHMQIVSSEAFDQAGTNATATKRVDATSYILMGGKVYMKAFTPGCHGNKKIGTRHCAVNAIGGEYPEFYLSGMFRSDFYNMTDNPHAYLDGGKFGIVAGAGMESVGGKDETTGGDVTFKINHSWIDEFYGGGINANRPVTGNIDVTCDNSIVHKYCGGPKLGDMSNTKYIHNTATGSTFNYYYGGGNGGTNNERRRIMDSNGATAAPNNNNKTTAWNGDYGFQNFSPFRYDGSGAYETEFEFELLPDTRGTDQVVKRTYSYWASFAKTTVAPVTNTITDCTFNTNFYGGGNLGAVGGDVTSTLSGSTVVKGSAFGAGFSASIPSFKVHDKSTVVYPYRDFAGFIHDGSLEYGATEYTWIHDVPAEWGISPAPSTSNPTFTHEGKSYCYTEQELTGLGAVSGSTSLTIEGTTNVQGNVYGGGDQSAVNTNSTVIIQGSAVVTGDVFGAGNAADVDGAAAVTVKSGTMNDVYGGGRGETTVVGGAVTVNIGEKDGVSLTGTGAMHDVYGGSALGTVNAADVNIYAGAISGSVYGGGKGQLAVVEPATPAVAAQNLGKATVTVEGATVAEAVYGGSNINGVLKNDAEVTILGGTIGTERVGEVVKNVVFGGGFGEPTLVEGNVTVNVGTLTAGPTYTGTGIIHGNVYGGGALGNVNTSKPASELVFDDTKYVHVNLYAGTINGNVFGGGLGQKAAAAVLYTAEDAEVIGGTKNVGDVKTPAATAVAAYVGGDVTVLLDGAELTKAVNAESVPITSQIFGGNNLNGTPKGDVLVHVKRTMYSSKSDATAFDDRETYDVAAVYGGGNQADYVPTKALSLDEDTKKEASAKVIIEGCDLTSIEYVYGGGNAAAVPATDVTIRGTYIIDYLFGGGNGKSTASFENPGADVGIYNGAPYGTGIAKTTLYAGKVRTVFGGSNTKGNVHGGTSMNMPPLPPTPPSPEYCSKLEIKNIYGAGNEAEQDGDVNLVLGCVDGMENVYGGAKNAHIKGGVNLTITSGHFTKVFGGNDQSGTIQGGIKLNIEETGCEPITIDNLYLGGNLAPYSVYGYKNTGTEESPLLVARTGMSDGVAYNPPASPYSESQLYHDPELNVISCTHIKNVYGGGYGSTANLYGSPTVNVNMVKGNQAGLTVALPESYAEIPNITGSGDAVDGFITRTINDDIGTIGNVFGGGEEANVYGNATVNIGTAATVTMTSVEDDPATDAVNEHTPTVLGANITGSVYGGGKDAVISGDTKVFVSARETGVDTYATVTPGASGVAIAGNVFGAGLGLTTTVDNTIVVMGGGSVMKSVYGGGEKGSVEENTKVIVMAGAIGDPDNEHGGATYGNVYGGGQGEKNISNASDGLVKGDTYVTISGGSIYHNIYGGGAYGSVGTYTHSEGVTTCTSGGTANVTVTGGTIGINGKENGMVFGSSRGDVDKPTGEPALDPNDRLAWVNNTVVTIGILNDETPGPQIKGSIYGSGENGHTYENTSVTINSGTIGINSAEVVIYKDDSSDPSKVTFNDKAFNYPYRGNVYGGGCGTDKYDSNSDGTDDTYNPLAGIVKGAATVTINGGTVVRNVYGAGAMGSVDGKTTVNIHGGTIGPEGSSFGYVYAAARGDESLDDAHQAYVGASELNITNGTILGDAFGGGQAGIVKGAVSVTLSGGTVGHDVYGGGALAKTNTEYDAGDAEKDDYVTTVTFSGGTITGNLYGGGLGRLEDVGEGITEVEADVNGPVTVAVTGGTAANVFGCNNINGEPKAAVDVQIGSRSGAPGSYTYSGTATISGSVYGGGKDAAYSGTPTVKIYKGTVENNVYGGGLGATATTGGSSVTMEGGTVNNDVFGGGSLANVTGSVAVTIAGGTVVNDVYGGGALANTNTANWNTAGSAIEYVEVDNASLTPTYSIKEIPVGESVVGYFTYNTGTSSYVAATGTAVKGTTYYQHVADASVTGYYTRSGTDPNYVYTPASGSAAGGTTYYKKKVVGGWAATHPYTTTVVLTGGVIGNAYGGGLGSSTVAANVYGDVKVTVNKPAEMTSTGGSGIVFTRRTTNVTFGGKEYVIPVTGRVFGCNNINGTPTGNVRVEVYATRQIEYDDFDNYTLYPISGTGSEHSPNSHNKYYEVQAVYGGGNLSDYLPATGSATSVYIGECDVTSIEKVYGGGNSAVVPSSEVVINGSFDIGTAFGGGNGGDLVKKDGVWSDNDGAIVIGQALIRPKGGKVGEIFGGSDAKGFCGNPIIDKTEHNDDCPLVVTRMYGAGKESDVDHVDIIISGCTAGNTDIEYVFGGSYNAHIAGDINLTIKAGVFKNVFGGNDRTGSIGGNITVNIEETENCVKPLIIQNLFGGGNEAPYPGTKRDDTEYDDPGKITVNVKSATRIDNIFGGSLKADVNGDTEVNINMTKGYWAGKTYDGKLIPDSVGVIGNVYGGGNQGVVRGNSTVNIATESTVDFITEPTSLGRKATGAETLETDGVAYIENPNGTFKTKVLGARIKGDVFGGGNEANVNGNATVNICTADYSGVTGFQGVSIDKASIGGGSVYGGGNRADVLGNTNVTVSGGYIFNGVFGGGYSGSVGTYERSTEAEDVNIFGHTSHSGTCIGKPVRCTSGGTCTVLVDGGQIGPVTVATQGMPVPQGWVWGGGYGLTEDPATNPDTHFKTYVNQTDVTIGGTAFIMEGVIGGGEFGRVLGNTHVTIQDHCQIGVGKDMAADDKPVRYTDGYDYGSGVTANQFVDPTTTAITESNALNECRRWPYGRDTDGDGKKDEFLPYDPYYKKYPETHFTHASTDNPSDGQTWIGVVFGGGSGYMPYEKSDGSGYDWIRSAGWVEGNTLVEIKGGHVLTNVYGGNEYSDVGTEGVADKGKCVVKMTGGTIGVPRTLAQIEEHPLGCYLYGAGKGDQRTHFNVWTNVKETDVEVSGGIIYGSVFGGGEDGHVLGNAKVTIKDGAKIGTCGTSYVEGNVFGGGRGFSGESLTAGSVGGNATVDIQGGIMLGSVYGGGRMASVGIPFTSPTDNSYGQLLDDKDGKTYGHITINISGGTIGTTTESGDNHPVGGNVFGGSMGRITMLNGDLNPLWPKQAVVKLTNITISGTADIKNHVYGGSEYGIVRNYATVNMTGGTIHGNLFGGGYGSDEQDTTVITPAGYSGVHYAFTPMMWTGCVSGSTFVNISGGTVKKCVYGGGEMASVGLIDFASDEDGNFTNMPKHDDLSSSFGLSWPFKFAYHAAAPNDPADIGGGKINGKATVNISGEAEVGTKDGSGDYVSNTGYVFGGCKGKVWFGATKDTEQDITKQRYTEALCGNVHDTEVTIDGGTMRTVYGGGEDGHVDRNTKVTVNSGTIERSLFGGGKGASTYKAKLLNPSSPGNLKATAEDVRSWTAGKVYGNTEVIMNGGSVGWFIYGGGNMASVGKGNYAGGSDDYATGGYGETLNGAAADADKTLWDGGNDNSTAFLNSGKSTVTVKGGTVGPTEGDYQDEYGIPLGSVFGGSRGQTAPAEVQYEPRYRYAPDFYIGYVNRTAINIGGTAEDGAVLGAGPDIYGSVYGGGQDGHVRDSTAVKIFKGNIKGQASDGIGRSGNVFGAGSGIGTYTVDAVKYCNSSSGSVTCTTWVEVNGETSTTKIAGNVYGGGALASVGPPNMGQEDKNGKPYNEHKTTDTPYDEATPRAHGSKSYTKVNINGGTISGSVFGAGRGPGSSMFTSEGGEPFTGIGTGATQYNSAVYATTIWTEVNVKGGAITGNVYGGGEMGRVNESTEVNLKGGKVTHDAYGGGKGTRGTNAIPALVLGNTTVKLNEGVADDEKGCVVDKIYGCNDLNGSPKGHVLVHVYATQKDGQDDISHKVAPPTYTAARGETKHKTYLSNLITEAKAEGGLAASATVITDAEYLLNTTLAEVAEDDLSADQKTSIETAAKDIITALEALHDYDVTAVYGGGNLAMYQPYGPAANNTEADYKATAEKTEVIIEGCNTTSIQQVYGGGNAACAPATDVLVKSCFIIDEVFGGGNGKDNYTLKEGSPAVDKWYENPGAHVGYIQFATYTTDGTKGTGADEEHKYQAIIPDEANDDISGTDAAKAYRQANYRYGTGVANTVINGGHIHTIYGGSNEKGNISGEARSEYQQIGTCPMLYDEAYGAGKNADIDAVSNQILDCVDNYDNPGTIYGGAFNANINSDVNIYITNGSYDKIFGGNNEAGTINGKITITIEEYGCTPIRINELYAGGNLAPYSVYGFSPDTELAKDVNGNNRAGVYQRIPYSAGDVGALETPRRDPYINIVSASYIGKIFGGGYGAGATMIGNPHINVNMTEGKIRSKYNDYKAEYATKYPTYDSEAEDKNRVIPVGTIDYIYGGGNLASVEGNTYVEIGTGTHHNDAGELETITPARKRATINYNVFGGGKGQADTYLCDKAMVGVAEQDPKTPDLTKGNTSVIIGNALVKGSVYGGGEIGRVQNNTSVTIGIENNATDTITINGNVFAAGKGVDTHGFSGLTLGNSTVIVQGKAKVLGSVYGGGETATVGRYNTDENGVPVSLYGGGDCTVTIRDDAEIGPDNMTMTKVGGPDNAGHVFGGGKGATPVSDYTTARHAILGNSAATFASEAAYLAHIETLALVSNTDVTIDENAFVKGDVFGGAENGLVQEDTYVKIKGNCQIGNGYAQMDDNGDYLDLLASPVTPKSINRRYTPAEWAAGHLFVAGDPAFALTEGENPVIADETERTLRSDLSGYYTSSLPECASWKWGQAANAADRHAVYDPFYGTGGYDSKGGRTTADDGHSFYGNVFGGGSGYFPYKPGTWHWNAGLVKGNTRVDITGGHILTNVYGGNEMTNVNGKCTINMSGGTIGVPRTLGQMSHPVGNALFGGGMGDPRSFFHTSGEEQTNVNEVEVNVSGGWIYGSIFGGAETGHVIGDVNVTVSGGSVANPTYADYFEGRATKIGTTGTSAMDGNIFGGGRGYDGKQTLSGRVGGNITVNISGGEMLGSVYGGGRLGSVGIGNTVSASGRADMQSGDDHGVITVNITGGTIGNDEEFQYVDESNYSTLTGSTGALRKTKFDAAASFTNKIKDEGGLITEAATGTRIHRLSHTAGGNVFAGCMGLIKYLDGTTFNPNWSHLGLAKKTVLNISGANTRIKGNVYGGAAYGAVANPLEAGIPAGTTINISGGTIGTAIMKEYDDVDVPQYYFGSVYGGGYGTLDEFSLSEGDRDPKDNAGIVMGSTSITMSGGTVLGSVYGGGEMAQTTGSATVTVSGGEVGVNKVRKSDGYVMYGSSLMGNVYGAGKGNRDYTKAGVVMGNTNVTIQNSVADAAYAAAHDGVSEGDIISSPKIYHNVYGGGALASVGTFLISDGNGTPSYIPIAGVPYSWTGGTGTATINITGGTIGINGRDNGMVNGSSRGDLKKPDDEDPDPEVVKLVDPYDRVAWVNDAVVTIGTNGQGSVLTTPIIKGSVYGGGENGHNGQDATVTVYSGTIGVTDTADPWYDFGNETINKKALATRGNVYGGGCGTDTYTGDDGKEYHNPKSGLVGRQTTVNIYGGHVGNSVYGGGSMGSVGTIINASDTATVAKHTDDATSFALSWPYKFEYADGTGITHVNIYGGHIGTRDLDGGDVFGSTRGEAADRYVMAHLASVKETHVTVNYSSMPSESDIPTIENDFTTQCITGSVLGSGLNGYVYGDTHVTLDNGLIGHSLYGGGKGNGTYKEKVAIILGEDAGTLKDADIYGLLSGKVLGNTYVTMNGGHVVRNVYGGGNMGSVGKGNYSGGSDDYYPAGYGETITGALWEHSEDFDPNEEIGPSNQPETMADYFLSSGKTTVKVLGGKVGYINPAQPPQIKNNLPYGNVFGGSAGEAAPNVYQNPRYLYSPAFYSGYVNETDVTIGKARTDFTGEGAAAAYAAYVASGTPVILGSVYGGGQDGHVRRDTKVTVNNGEIGMAYNAANQTLLRTDDAENIQWLLRGNVFGGGSGIGHYLFDFNGDGDYEDTFDYGPVGHEIETHEEDYSESAGSVSRFTEVNINGGTIHRSVYGGGSIGTVGPPHIDQDYLPNKKGDSSEGRGPGKQTLCSVNIAGTIGTVSDYTNGYGGNVFGACRGIAGLAETRFGVSTWTKVNILKGAIVRGNVFGGGDNGMVKRDAEVIVGAETPQ